MTRTIATVLHQLNKQSKAALLNEYVVYIPVDRKTVAGVAPPLVVVDNTHFRNIIWAQINFVSSRKIVAEESISCMLYMVYKSQGLWCRRQSTIIHFHGIVKASETLVSHF